MGCCGRGHAAPAPPVTPTRAGARVIFEHRGSSPLTTYGRVTGIRYHFPGPGARVSVDPRDAPALEIVRGLEVVPPRDRS